jgi:multiple sugar transport system permease protein
MHKKMNRQNKNKIIAFFFFISPWLICYLLFTLGPIVMNFAYSFSKYDAIRDPVFIGLGNYKEMLKDMVFWKSLNVTVYYTIFFVPLAVIGTFLLAALLNQKIPLLGIWRTTFYLPVVTSGVAVALLFMWLFQPTYGLVNIFIYQLFGVQGPGWFFDEKFAIPATIVMGLWGIGAQMLVYLAGLQSIPTQLYEAAMIDGAGTFRKFFCITVPMMTPVIFYNLVICIINSFQVFTPAFVITSGGPNYATYFYVLHLFNSGFRNYRFGYASALACVLFILILLMTFFVFRTARSWVYAEGESMQ